jgi:hypothetical protein
MPEYTIAVIISLLLLLVADLWIVRSKLILSRRFQIFIFMVIVLQTIVDNYLNGRWWLDSFIVGPYPEQFYSGIRIIETPLENYGFGIAMMWLTVMIFESLPSTKTNL